MTVIVWDGKTLAADKRANSSGLIFKVTKIKRIKDKLVGGAGDLSSIRAMMDWYENGADPKNLPDCQKDKDRWTALLIISGEGKIYRIEQDGYPFEVEEETYAIGCGRDIAVGAMAMGADAVRAVEIASRYDAGCGNGVDTLSIV